ncbi:hypothetical protein AVEN_155117-1, partial [Araneus ventricosus]
NNTALCHTVYPHYVLAYEEAQYNHKENPVLPWHLGNNGRLAAVTKTRALSPTA